MLVDVGDDTTEAKEGRFSCVGVWNSLAKGDVDGDFDDFDDDEKTFFGALAPLLWSAPRFTTDDHSWACCAHFPVAAHFVSTGKAEEGLLLLILDCTSDGSASGGATQHAGWLAGTGTLPGVTALPIGAEIDWATLL